jgi:signal transduction histidine kinase
MIWAHRRFLLASLVVGIPCAAVIAAIVLGLNRPASTPALSAGDVVFTIAISAVPAAAAVVLAQRPGRVVGWGLAAAGGFYGLGLLAWELGGQGNMRLGSHEPAIEVALAWLGSWAIIAAPLPVFVALLHFPDGRPASRRAAWLTPAVGFVGALVIAGRALKPGPLNGTGPPNPVGWVSGARILADLQAISLPLLFLIALAVVGTLVLRFVRSDLTVRAQLKWLLLGASALPLGIAVGAALGSGAVSGSPRDLAASVVFSIGIVAVPLAIAIAMVRHRLYDVDLLISRGLVYLALAIGVTGVYTALVAGVGYLVGSRAPNLLLAILATALIAIAFQPARLRLQDLANRIVYGKRTSPAQALSDFVRRVGQTFDPETLLRQIAVAVGEGVAADQVEVWMSDQHQVMVPVAAWPGAHLLNSLPPPGDWHLERIEDAGELLGAIVIRPRAGEKLSSTEAALVKDLALHAGLAVRNYRLSSELIQRIEDLRAASQRLVTAQDVERRRIERNLHDGAQQHLIALRLNLQLAIARLAESDPTRIELVQLLDQADTALSALRELAQGIHPTILTDRGLVVALGSSTRSAPVPVTVHADGIGRYEAEVEATVYFCCIEALQNVYKHSDARSAHVTIEGQGTKLRFQVTDDGRGIPAGASTRGAGLRNMSDRIKALGGEIDLVSNVECGATVMGWLPTAPLDRKGPGLAAPPVANADS